jgi:NAD(P)-dependent dehydrogenase (short-subunit alcohol dehydrogenase family)
MRLRGKVAFITGAGMGQGREAALLFAREGARVIVGDISAKAGQETVRRIERRHGKGLYVEGDVGVERDVKRMIETGVRKFGALHILYNNAGVLWKDRDRSVTETSEPNWDRVMAINLKGPFFVTKYGIPYLIKSGGGSIINVGSVSALCGFTVAQDAYTSAKGALISLTKSLAVQFARHHIRCNIIHPGIIETPMQSPYPQRSRKRKSFEDSIPLSRIAHPRESPWPCSSPRTNPPT